VHAQLRARRLALLRGLRFIKSTSSTSCAIFRFQRDFISARADGDTLQSRGSRPQVHVMGFEIYVLAIVNELYFQAIRCRGRSRGRATMPRCQDRAAARVRNRAAACPPFEFFDFGVRTPFSAALAREVVTTLKREVPQYFKGTSNVLARPRSGLGPDRDDGARIP